MAEVKATKVQVSAASERKQTKATKAVLTLEVPTYYVTTIATMSSSQGEIVRVAFGESVSGSSKFHLAVALNRKTAQNLVDSITTILAKTSKNLTDNPGVEGV